MMSMKFYFLFFVFYLFSVKTEAVVKINSIVTPLEDCPYDKYPDKNNNVSGSGACLFNITATGVSGSDNTYIKNEYLTDFYVHIAVMYRYTTPVIAYSIPIPNVKEGTVNEIAALAISEWGLRVVNLLTYSDNPIAKVCVAVGEVANYTRPEFGNECGSVDPGPDPDPNPGSCDLGGPYYLSHGSMVVDSVNGNEARVNINVSCTQDAMMTIMAPNELDLGLNIVSQITLDGLKPDGLNLSFSKPGRPLVFASKLQTIGTPEAGTFDKVYLLQATIQ
ncbi:hypothetical protein K7H94_18640 [Pantoea dispersa]|uniref:hypothetical protein n=1 Tax=Pantoea dispersa TaxID=59814 RepID=UPI001CA6859D|nr:hypothetical protein [Pantoea dispersa]QZY90366.1 hypothetical protein K7H94_18640 [Pantoea dispersa]